MASSLTHLDERQFLLTVKRLADAIQFGSDPSPYRGSGIDYAQSRAYAPGDPVRSIDWRVTARMGKVYVKEFESLKQMPVYVLLDQSLSMGVSSLSVSKWEWSVLLAGAIGLAGLLRGSPVGLFGSLPFDGRSKTNIRYQPSQSRSQLYQALGVLRQLIPSGRHPSQLRNMLREVEISAHEKSLVILLSDLHEAGLLQSIKRLAIRHEVLVLHMRDPAECSIPVSAYLRGQEAETLTRFTLAARKQFQSGTISSAEVRRGGADIITLQTDYDFLPALKEFFQTRTTRGLQ